AQERSLITLLPDKKFIPSFTAGGTEHRISYAKLLSEGSFIGSLGGFFPAALITIGGKECLIGVGSTLYTTLQSGGIKYNVTNADFYVDLTFDVPVTEQAVIRFGAGHTSHHLVDDGVAAAGAGNVLNYARDYYQLFYVHRLPLIRGFLYGGTYYTYSFLINSRRDGQFLFQAGADGGNIPLYSSIALYGAVDFKVRSEVNYGSTQSYQVGIRTMNELYRAIRFAYTYRTGIDERGQFYNRHIDQHSLGLFFDF
ncbi:MAG: DUF1207 domain-containing protein, partial [Bacteroidota bacterium]